MNIPQAQSSDDAVSVGEIASEVALTSRPADADDNSDAESAAGDVSDDDAPMMTPPMRKPMKMLRMLNEY